MKFWESGGIPFGYSYDHTSKKLLINPHEREILFEIINLYQENLGVHLIAQRLNEKKIPTRRSNRWSTNTISTILSPKRLEFYRKFDYESPDSGLFKPLLSQDEYHRIIEHRQSNKLIAPRSPKKRYLLSGIGILKCGYCGGPVKASVTKKNDQTLLYYLCTNRQTSGRSTCLESKLHPQDRINTLVEQDLKLKSNPSSLNMVRSYIKVLKEDTTGDLKKTFDQLAEKFTNKVETETDEAIKSLMEGSLKIKESWGVFKEVEQPVEFQGEDLQGVIKKNISVINLFNEGIEIVYKYPINNWLERKEKIPLK